MNAAFFFSGVSMNEKKKGNIQEENEGSEEEPDQSLVPSTSSEQWLNVSRTRVNKLLWPSLTYWIALTSPNGTPTNAWWFIGPCSSVEWVSQQNRYGVYSWQIEA